MGIRVHVWVLVPFIAAATIGLLLVLRRRSYPASRLALIALFVGYLTGVASFAFFPVTLEADFIETMRRNATPVDGINPVPFRDLTTDGIGRRQLIGNVLLGIPFGFGLPFLIQRSTRSLLAWGIAFALSIEVIQLLTNISYGFAYRVVDINDLMLNVLGVVLGLAAFRLVCAVYRHLGILQRSGRGSYLHRILST